MNAEFLSLARSIRQDIAEMVIVAGRGHLAPAFSLVEILLILYRSVLRIDPKFTSDPQRDRLILSKGHGCLALYAVLAERGFFPREELWRFCQYDGILGGHPEQGKIPGVEATTGALGHGLSIGVGMALAARLDRFAYRTYVILGDGECNEGTIWEAALCASKHRLSNLVVLVDYNKMQSYGRVSEVLELEPFKAKWEAFGFVTEEVDLERPQELLAVLQRTEDGDLRPLCVLCHTVKGKGVSFMEHNPHWHHRARLTEHEISQIRKELES